MIPRKTARPARVRGLTWLFLALAGLALLSTGNQIVGFYTDWLWFHEVQFTSVFVTVLQTQVLLGVVTGAAFFLILYGNVILARRLASREVLLAVDDTPGLPSPEVLDLYLRRLIFPLSVMIALFVGWLGTDRWELVLKALHPTPFGVRDPLFRPGRGVLCVPAPALEFSLSLADGELDRLGSGRLRRVFLYPRHSDLADPCLDLPTGPGTPPGACVPPARC